MQPDPSDSLVFECDLDEPPEKVWRALTEPRLLEAWLTPDDLPRTDSARTDSPRTDSERGQAAPREPVSDHEILTAEPHRLLRYRWRDRESGVGDSSGREVHSVVTVELTPCPTGGTHLRLTHGDFRIVSSVPAAASRVTPIASARRRKTPILSFAMPSSLRRAA